MGPGWRDCRIGAAAFGLALMLAAPVDAACRQALALGLDVSGSVDMAEYRLQLDGLAAALGDPEVGAALLSQNQAPIRLFIFEWSGPQDLLPILDWTEVHDLAELAAIQDVLRRHERPAMSPTTALGSALAFGVTLLRDQPECWKRTLDLSGDGPNNMGPRPQDLAASASDGITVNALVIGAPNVEFDDLSQGDIKALSSYFRTYVLRGPSSFVETALGFDDYQEAMRRKLLRELQSLAIGQTAPSVARPPRPAVHIQ